jgi:hypothetical protein
MIVSMRLLTVASVVVLLVILPVLITPHLLLLDAPAHEARIAILRDLLLPGKASPFYHLDTFFLPNIGFDVIGFALSFVASAEDVGRIFFALTLILTVFGISVLNRVATGRWSVVPLASGLLLYNLVTIFGFFSYAFGLALVPWALAGRLTIEPGPPVARFLVGASSAILLLFCHVFDFGIYAVMSAGFALAALYRGKIDWAGFFLRLLESVPAGLIFLAMSTGSRSHFRYDANFLPTKIFQVVKSLTSGSMVGDAAFFIGMSSFILALALCARTRFVSSFLPGIVALLVLYFVLPQNLESGSYVDVRMPIAAALMLLASLDVQILRKRGAAVLLAVLAIALVTKQVAIATLWRSMSFATDGLIHQLDTLPAAAIIMQSECQVDTGGIQGVYARRQPSLQHIASIAAFRDSHFVATEFAIPGQQPIGVAPAYLPYHALQNQFDHPTCEPAESRKRLGRIADLAHSELAAGHPVPPIFYLLIRPISAMVAAPEAALISSGPAYALYKVNITSR